jgi:hypothetical protein
MLTALVYFVLPTLLLVLGLPIFVVLLATCLVAVLLVADVPTEAVQTYIFGSLDNFPLLAVPFFVLAGEIMAQGGIARRVVVWVISLIGGYADRSRSRLSRPPSCLVRWPILRSVRSLPSAGWCTHRCARTDITSASRSG